MDGERELSRREMPEAQSAEEAGFGHESPQEVGCESRREFGEFAGWGRQAGAGLGEESGDAPGVHTETSASTGQTSPRNAPQACSCGRTLGCLPPLLPRPFCLTALSREVF